jgi:iron-sulfur cluster repair protein YtfE (RIC family)
MHITLKKAWTPDKVIERQDEHRLNAEIVAKLKFKTMDLTNPTNTCNNQDKTQVLRKDNQFLFN